jgi:DNA polymerase elongation subunit (family B)
MCKKLMQVLQWVFETDFVYLFCKSIDDKRIILKVHSLNLQTLVLVDNAASLPLELVEEFQDFLTNNAYPCELVHRKKFGTFFNASGDDHRRFQFVSITHPSNGHPIYYLKNILRTFERKHSDHGFSLKTYHLNLDPIVRIFQNHPTFSPCMFVELDDTDPHVNFIRVRTSWQRYNADAMYSLPIAKLTRCKDPPPFNFPLRVVAFDFECTGANVEKDVIYQVSFVFETVNLNETVSEKNTKFFLLNVGECDNISLDGEQADVTLFVFETEKQLLVKMMFLLAQNEWDCITGFHVYGFDFPMLESRLRKYGLESHLRKWNRVASTNKRMGTFHKKISGKGEEYLTIVYPQLMGRFHFDLLPVIRKNFSKLKYFSLAFVSTKFLGTTKIDIPYDCDHPKPCSVENCKTQKNLYKLNTSAALAEIGQYCVVDSHLCIKLVKKLNIIGNQIEFANVVYFPLNRLFTTGEMVKIGASIYVNGFVLGFVFEDKPYVENPVDEIKTKYQGARVLDAKAGAYLYNIICCLDFASLYPSIIIRWNICPSTLTTKKPAKENLKYYKEIKLDDGGERVWVHQHVKGVLPVLLTKLWTGRKEVKREMKDLGLTKGGLYGLLDAKQKALKVSMNSVYGIFGAKVGDMAFTELSRAVCAVGRTMIDALETTITKEHKDMSVIYGDSVTASTPIVIREMDESGIDLNYHSLPIQDFWEMQGKVSNMTLDHRYHETKEAYDLTKTNLEIYSDEGWTKIKRVIRHKPASKRLYRVRVANGSQVEVTGDHSLLLKDGTCITPAKLKVGDILMVKKFEGLDRGGCYGKNNFIGVPDFSKDEGEHEIHLFDLYHTQLMIQFLGPFFVQVVLSGQTFRILYNIGGNGVDPFFTAIDPGTVTNIIRFNYDKDDWVYDLETENHHFSGGLGTIVVHNTDSVFVKLPTQDEKVAFDLSESLAHELTTQLFKDPILLEFEKIYNPLILFKKKNYVGLKKESINDMDYTMEEKGLISVQKSTPACVAHIYQDVIDTLLREKNPFSLYEMSKVYMEKMLNDEILMQEFVQSTRLKGDYVNPLAIPHSRVAMNANSRAGTEIYKAGDRVQYVHYCPPNLNTFEIDALKVAEKVEDPNFVLSRGYKINYRSYLQKMQTAFLELAKFFPEVYKLEQDLLKDFLNDARVNDNIVVVKGGRRKTMIGNGGEKCKPLKKRKISSYFLPIVKKEDNK